MGSIAARSLNLRSNYPTTSVKIKFKNYFEIKLSSRKNFENIYVLLATKNKTIIRNEQCLPVRWYKVNRHASQLSLREPLPLLYLANANNRSCNLRSRHVVVQAANATSKVTPLLQSNILYKHGRRWLRPTPGARPPSVLPPWHQTHPLLRIYALVMKCFLTWNCLSRRDGRRHARLSTEQPLFPTASTDVAFIPRYFQSLGTDGGE